MKRLNVLIALPVFEECAQRLQEHFDVEAHTLSDAWPQAVLINRMQGKAGVFVAGGECIDATLLDACPELLAVCSMAVGYNNIDVVACTARGVLVTNAPGVLTETTADFGFALMMATARRIAESEHFLRSGKWERWSYDLFAGSDVHGATLGILGMGRIGQGIARRGALGFGMKVIYHNRTRLSAEVEQPLGAVWVRRDELMAQADHLVIVLPYGPDTHHVVGARELALMKPSATLTNIARGGVVDDAALAEALLARRIAAAGLDVYEGEPRVHAQLLTVPNVVLTPHIASASIPTRRAMANLAVDNLIGALTARRPLTPLNAKVLESQRWRAPA